MDVAHLALIGLAALAAGAVNAIAGGGSLITFPVLVASGLPAITASMTNTVAMCPGYLGAVVAQRRDLEGQGGRALRLLPVSIAGSLVGSFILLHTTERAFQAIVPFLLVFAATLLALQDRLRAYLTKRSGGGHSVVLAAVPIGLASIYGAYFGAGLGVIILAVLAVVVDDALVRANALKQALSLVINVCGALVFVFVGTVAWQAALVIAVTSLAGGFIGGALASRVPELLLRVVVVVVALVVAAVYVARL